jgi:uncharacterized protein YukE
MAFEGANPDQLDALAGAFNTAASRLADVRSTLTARVNNTTWRGDSADRFRYEWNGRYARQLEVVINCLLDARSVLTDNANQQRHASGEPVAAPVNPIVGFLAKAEHAVEGAVREGEKDLGTLVHNVQTGVGEVWSAEVTGFHEVVSSPEFGEALGVLQTVSTVAGIVALIPIPGVEEVAAAVAIGAGAAVLVGHAAQMANTGKWDFGKLAEDGLDVGLNVVGAGAAGKALEGASKLDLIANASKPFADLSGAEKAVTVVRAAQVGVDEGQTTKDVVTDVGKGDYGQAAVDSVGFVAAPLGLGGEAAEPIKQATHALQTVADAGYNAPKGPAAVLEELGK